MQHVLDELLGFYQERHDRLRGCIQHKYPVLYSSDRSNQLLGSCAYWYFESQVFCVSQLQYWSRKPSVQVRIQR